MQGGAGVDHLCDPCKFRGLSGKLKNIETFFACNPVIIAGLLFYTEKGQSNFC